MSSEFNMQGTYDISTSSAKLDEIWWNLFKAILSTQRFFILIEYREVIVKK